MYVFILAAYLTLPLPFFSQFPNGLLFATYSLRAMNAAAWYLSTVGELAAAVGLVTIIWCLWAVAALVLIGACILAVATSGVLGLVLLIIRPLKSPRFKKTRQKPAQ